MDLHLTNKQIHVWSVDMLFLLPNVIKFRNFLSQKEQGQADRFKFIKDSNYYIIARFVLKTILSRYLKCDVKSIKFAYNDYGKPYLTNTDLRFNLSHSGDYTLIACTLNDEIGVDVECINYKNNLEQLVKRFFSELEYKQFVQLSEDDKLRGFFTAWTRKEAFVKALGKGFSFALNSFDVNFQVNEPARILAVRDPMYSNNKWQLQDVPIASLDYCAAVAWCGEKKELQFMKYSDLHVS